jgi:hypothetical protein
MKRGWSLILEMDEMESTDILANQSSSVGGDRPKRLGSIIHFDFDFNID